MFDAHDEEAWLGALKGLNRKIKFVVSGIGEPVLLKRFRAFSKRAYQEAWFDSMVIFTNLSRLDPIAEYKGYHDRIKFNASYHPTEMAFDRFKEGIAYLSEMNLLNNVSTVAYKYAFAERMARQFMNVVLRGGKKFQYAEKKFELEKAGMFVGEMKKNGIRVTIQGIDALIPAYTKEEKAFIQSTRAPGEGVYLFREPASYPRSKACRCGEVHVICDHHGNFWRCSQYINSVDRLTSSGTHGNLFHEARLDREPKPCHMRRCSIAREEYAMRTDNDLFTDRYSNVLKKDGRRDP